MKRVLRSQADFQQTILRNQLTSLVLFESVSTTKTKAARLAAFADHFFARVKSADMNAIRLAHHTMLDKNAAIKTFEEILPRYDKAATSFVRVLRLMPRAGDSAEMRQVSFQKPLTATTKKVEKSAAPTPAKEPKTVKKVVAKK